MAISSDGKKRSVTFRRYEDGDHKPHQWSEQIWQAGWSHKCPTYVHRAPPCQGACPAGEDIRGWLAIVRGVEKPARGMTMQEYAFRRATDANPFPAVMGRVCPAPCEKRCNRQEVEEHVGINSVEQYIGDAALKANLQFTAGPGTGKRVAIIGGGPAGLAAAYQLRRKGHGVTIFDALPKLGGMMRYGIPGYRMPRDILDGEIDRIVNLGVEVKCGVKVGRDIALADLENQYDAILFAMGAQSGRTLSIPGADAVNCTTGIAFLAAFNQGRLKHVSGKVVVVGGGDTSIDVASVARRIGHITVTNENERPEYVIRGQTAGQMADSAKRRGADVTLISRAPIEKMPAAPHEIENATREGVKIFGRLLPVEVIKNSDGRATGLKVAKLDEKGHRIGGSEYVIEADLIVAAIGQRGDLEGFDRFTSTGGLIDADKHFQVPQEPGYFAAGDVVHPHLLSAAIGQAAIAAESIDHYLKGESAGARPKIDVRHFNLMSKLAEAGLQPDRFQPKSREEIAGREGFAKEIDLGVRGTCSGGFAVHNYEDRAAHEIIPADHLFLGHFSFAARHPRGHVEVNAEQVLGHFEERLIPLAELEAIDEAKRCMSCGMCFECDNCVVFCPQAAVKRVPATERTTGRYVITDYAKCIGCHICADVCPTGYIDMGMGE